MSVSENVSLLCSQRDWHWVPSFRSSLSGWSLPPKPRQPRFRSPEHGNEVVVFAMAEVAADDVTTWDVLTSYDRLPDFIPDMLASRTLERMDRMRWYCRRGARASARSSRISA